MLRELPEDAVVFVTSDHGFKPMPEATVTVPDRSVKEATDVTYLHARTRGALSDERVIAFDARRMGIPTGNGAARYGALPRPGYILRRQRYHSRPDRYSHGGVSLLSAWCRWWYSALKATDVPLLTIAELQQVGSVSEGDDLLAGDRRRGQGDEPGGDDDHLGVHAGGAADATRAVPRAPSALSATWTPRLDDITDEDRETQEKHLPVTVVLTYADKGKTFRTSAGAELVVKLTPGKLRRRVDSKLDFLMGKVPKGLKS